MRAFLLRSCLQGMGISQKLLPLAIIFRELLSSFFFRCALNGDARKFMERLRAPASFDVLSVDRRLSTPELGAGARLEAPRGAFVARFLMQAIQDYVEMAPEGCDPLCFASGGAVAKVVVDCRR